MTRVQIMDALDEEISRLRQVRQLLQGSGEWTPKLRQFAAPKAARQGRRMSAEGRRRIAEAQRRRWAKVKGL